MHHLQDHWIWKERIKPLGYTSIHIITRSRLSSKWRTVQKTELSHIWDIHEAKYQKEPMMTVLYIITISIYTHGKQVLHWQTRVCIAVNSWRRVCLMLLVADCFETWKIEAAMLKPPWAKTMGGTRWTGSLTSSSQNGNLTPRDDVTWQNNLLSLWQRFLWIYLFKNPSR